MRILSDPVTVFGECRFRDHCMWKHMRRENGTGIHEPGNLLYMKGEASVQSIHLYIFRKCSDRPGFSERETAGIFILKE